jgi:hypothetical protein
MRKRILSTMLVVLFSVPAFAAAPQTVPVVAGQMQTMKINEVMRMKVTKASDFSAAGIKGLKAGDEVEVKKISADKVEVKHLPSGQTGVMPQPK